MLNEERIKLMTHMAKYEEDQGRKDLRISSYYQKDYASLNTWIAVIWATIGYAIAAILVFLIFIDFFLKNITVFSLIMLIGVFLAAYIITVTITGILAHEFYLKKHYEARERVKIFNKELIYLDRMYEKEKK